MQLLAVSSTIQVMDPRSAQLLHQQHDPQSPSSVSSPTDTTATAAPTVLVANDAAGLDPVARARWGNDSAA